METWTNLYLCAFADAKRLRDVGSYRAAINRAYYALYYCITARVAHRAPFNKHGWRNPKHDQLPGLIAHIPGLTAVEKEELRTLVKGLYRERVDADYDPLSPIDRETARDVFNDLGTAFAILKEKI